MLSETISKLACLRCAYRWFPRKQGTPVRCPKCKSPYWNRPRAEPARASGRATESGADAGLRYFDEHEHEIRAKYDGQVIVLNGDGVVDADTGFGALFERIADAPPGSLVMRNLGPKPRELKAPPLAARRRAMKMFGAWKRAGGNTFTSEDVMRLRHESPDRPLTKT